MNDLPQSGDTVKAKLAEGEIVDAVFITYDTSGKPIVVLQEESDGKKIGTRAIAEDVEVKESMTNGKRRSVKVYPQSDKKVYVPAHYRGMPDWSTTVRRKNRKKQQPGISKIR